MDVHKLEISMFIIKRMIEPFGNIVSKCNRTSQLEIKTTQKILKIINSARAFYILTEIIYHLNSLMFERNITECILKIK